jgi:hypothetical protein
MVLWVMGTDSSEPSLIVYGIYVCAWRLVGGRIEDEATDGGCAEREEGEELHRSIAAAQITLRAVIPVKRKKESIVYIGRLSFPRSNLRILALQFLRL